MIFPLLKFKMINERGEEIKWDGKELGRLGTKGPHLIDGYIDNPEANAKSFDKEGYFYSGDVGVVSEEGYIATKDRIEDLIRGESGYVSPSTLEGIVGELPFVKEAGAVGIPSGEFEKPVVCVVLKDGCEGKVTVEEIRREFEGKVPGALPEVVILDELPRGSTGKWEKRSLKRLVESYFQEDRE